MILRDVPRRWTGQLLAWGRRRGRPPAAPAPSPAPPLAVHRRPPAARSRCLRCGASTRSGRCGVLRHDHDPARRRSGRDLARICRERGWCWSSRGMRGWPRHWGPAFTCAAAAGPARSAVAASVTSSAHSVQDLRRARRAGAALIFLSPAFPTASHAGAPGLGPLRWAAIARRSGDHQKIGALGGVDGHTVRRLPDRFASRWRDRGTEPLTLAALTFERCRPDHWP